LGSLPQQEPSVLMVEKLGEINDQWQKAIEEEAYIMQARAVARYVPLAARKANIVAALVRNKKVENALEVLKFTNKAGATFIEKLMRSALANANQMPDINIDNLYVKEIHVGNGPIRYWARYRGRLHVNRIRRRRCHIKIILDDGGAD